MNTSTIEVGGLLEENFFKDSTLIKVQDGTIIYTQKIRDLVGLKTALGVTEDNIERLQAITFGDRMKQFRISRGLSQTQMLDLMEKDAGVKMSISMLSHIETGLRYMCLEDFIAICRTFSISGDYLLGLSDDMNLNPKSGKLVTFNERFASLMAKHNYSSSEFSRKLASITRGEKTRSTLYARNVAKGLQRTNVGFLTDMAAVFGCSVDYLLGLDTIDD